MADMLGDAVTWLSGIRTANMTQSVTYSRGVNSVVLYATLGQTNYEMATEAGMTVAAVATDFLVTAAHLILGGVATMPAIGDTILLADGREFEVLDLGGTGHYRIGDPFGVTLRIHAKQTDE